MQRPDLEALPDWLYAIGSVLWLMGYGLRLTWRAARFCVLTLWELGGIAVYVAIGITALAAGIAWGL